MSINIDDLKKKIIYRSTYRGTKEMDALLSSFTKKYIDTLKYDELIILCNFLDIDDENLYNLNQGKPITNKIDNNKITELFKRFVYRND